VFVQEHTRLSVRFSQRPKGLTQSAVCGCFAQSCGSSAAKCLCVRVRVHACHGLAST